MHNSTIQFCKKEFSAIIKINNNLKEEEFESSEDEMTNKKSKKDFFKLKFDNQSIRLSNP